MTSNRTIHLSTGSLGPANAKKTTSNNDVMDDSPLQGLTVPYDTERRRSRIVLRSGSPRPLSKPSMRVNAGVSSLAISPLGKQPRPSILPAKGNTTSPPGPRANLHTRPSTAQSSLRISPPTRQPWGAPPLRTHVYQQQSLTRRKKASESSVDNSKPRPPAKQRRIQYFIDELLALRPTPDTLTPGQGQAATSSFGWSSETVVCKDPVIPSTKLPNLRRQQFPTLPEQSLFAMHSNMSLVGMNNWPYIMPSLPRMHPVFCSEGWDDSPAVQGCHPRTQSLDSPTTTRSKESASENQSVDIDDLETKIRSALSNRGRRRSITGGSRNLRTVHWGPALLADESKLFQRSIDDKSNISAELNAVEAPPKHQSIGAGQAPANTPTGNAKESSKKHRKSEFYKYLKNIAELRKGDRKKLLQLLEVMANIDSDDSDSDNEKKPIQQEGAKIKQTVRRLNPTATTFPCDIQAKQEDTFQTSETAQEDSIKVKSIKGQPSIAPAFVEPIWIKKDRLMVNTQEGPCPPISNENIPQSFMKASVSSPNYRFGAENATTSRHKITTTHPYGTFESPLYPPLVTPFSPMASLPGSIPLPPPSPLLLEGDINSSYSFVDPVLRRIPSEQDYGRIGFAHQWHEWTLQKFQKRYPLTGTKHASAVSI